MKNKHYIYGEVKAVPKNVEDTREIEFIISSENRDRHHTILKLDRWKLDNFNKNGIVGYQHNVYGGDFCNPPNPDDVIGRGQAYIDGNYLIGKAVFEPADINPLAEKIFRKVLFGTLRSTSVGFLETKEGDYGDGEERQGGENETYYYGEQELVEFSVVNIPSNTEAVKRHMRTSVDNALIYLDKVLGKDYPRDEIKEMKVGHVIDLISNRFYSQSEERAVKKELEKAHKLEPYMKYLLLINSK